MAPVFVLGWALVVFGWYWPAFRIHPADAWGAFTTQGLAVHPAEVAQAWTGFGRSALAAGAVLLAVRGAGRAAARVAGARGNAWLTAIPLGLGAAGAAVLGFGLAGLLFSPLLWAFVATLVLAGGLPRDLAVVPPGIPRWMLVLAGLSMLAVLPGALAPEVTYDALAYHLGAPGLFLGLHRIVRMDHMMFTDFPLALQMSYALGLACGGGDGAAKLVSFALGVGTIGAAASLGARLGGRAHAGWAMLFCAATPLLAMQMTKANADLGVALPAAAGAWWIMGKRTGRSAVVAGCLFGCAAAAKLTGGYALVAGVVVFLLADRAGSRRPGRGSAIVLLLAGAAATLGPWLVKSWLLTGNPVYPFASAWLGGLGWSAVNAAAYAKDMTEANSFNIQYPDWLSRVAAPWIVVMHDRGSAAALGPFALALLPAFLWLRAPAHRAAARLGLFAAAGWACWFLTARDPRFALPLWPALCALAGVAACELAGRAGTAVRAACLLGVACTAPFLAAQVRLGLNPGPLLWGCVPREAYAGLLLSPPRVYVPVLRLAGAAAGGDSLLVVGDVKAPFLRVRAYYPSMFDTPHLEAWVAESAAAVRLAVRLRQHRIGAVFFHQAGAVYLKDKFGPYAWTLRDRAVLRPFWERRLEPVREVRVDGALLGAYRVTGRPGPRRILPMPGDAP